MPNSLPAPQLNERHVLVVEDEPFLRIAFCDDLRAAGFSVIEAASADEALDCLRSGLLVEVVFSDIQMPGRLDGIGLARQLRRERPDLTIILTSGSNRPPADLNGIAFVPKPYDYGAVGRLMLAALSLQSRRSA